MNNQRGSALFFNILIFMLISFLGLRMLNFKMKTIKRSRYISKQYLCMKEYNGKTKHHVRNMEAINSVILIAKSIDYLSIAFPVLRPFVMVAQYLGKGVKAAQNAVHVAYMKNYYDWYLKGCYFAPNFIKTPYKHSGLLKRNELTGSAILRSKKWNQKLLAIKEKFILDTDVKKDGYFSTSYQTQELALPNLKKLQNFSIKEALQALLF